jgi:hypothetical protein
MLHKFVKNAETQKKPAIISFRGIDKPFLQTTNAPILTMIKKMMLEET